MLVLGLAVAIGVAFVAWCCLKVASDADDWEEVHDESEDLFK